MRGCDNCSGLMLAGDVFCPICGAGVQEADTAAGKVRIPVRRYGVIPPMPRTPDFAHTTGARSAIIGLTLTLVAASATAAVIYRLW